MGETKPTLLIIPSPLILGNTYKKLARELEKTFSVTTISLPATGLRFSGKLLWSADDYAELIALKLPCADNGLWILGHSNSGVIVSKLALLRPDKISGILLADTTGMKRFSYITTLVGRGLDGILEWKFSVWAIFHLLVNVIFHPLNFFYQVHLSVENESKDSFLHSKVKTIFLWGQRDHTMPLKDTEKVRRELHNSELYISKDGSHDWILTNVNEAAAAILTLSKPK